MGGDSIVTRTPTDRVKGSDFNCCSSATPRPRKEQERRVYPCLFKRVIEAGCHLGTQKVERRTEFPRGFPNEDVSKLQDSCSIKEVHKSAWHEGSIQVILVD